MLELSKYYENRNEKIFPPRENKNLGLEQCSSADPYCLHCDGLSDVPRARQVNQGEHHFSNEKSPLFHPPIQQHHGDGALASPVQHEYRPTDLQAVNWHPTLNPHGRSESSRTLEGQGERFYQFTDPSVSGTMQHPRNRPKYI